MKRIFRYLDNLKIPIPLAATAAGLEAFMRLGYMPEAWLVEAGIASRFLMIAAIGWAATAIISYALKRRIERLDLTASDNLRARKSVTRLDVLRRVWVVFGGVATLAAALTVVPWARQIGVSIFASAGIAGIAVGIAARPVLSNLIAGLQIAFTQPIRLDDVVIVEGEWGRIEEIDLFYVVVRIWDARRLVVPLSYFIEQPFQNWSRKSTQIIGTIYWALDYRAPIDAMRAKLDELVADNDLWDGQTVVLQVTEADRDTLQLRALASARNASDAWDLRCQIREAMIAWLQAEHPEALPRQRLDARLAAPSDALIEGLEDAA